MATYWDEGNVDGELNKSNASSEVSVVPSKPSAAKSQQYMCIYKQIHVCVRAYVYARVSLAQLGWKKQT